jgi:hypothetical protein
MGLVIENISFYNPVWSQHGISDAARKFKITCIEETMKGANEILVEYELIAISDEDIVSWAFEALLSGDIVANDICLIQLAELKGIPSSRWEANPGALLRNIVGKYYADFKIPSFETENYAKRALREKCAGYLTGETQYTEAVFTVAGNIEIYFDNPSWLGNVLTFRNYNIHLNQSVDFKKEIIRRLQEL